MKLLPKSELIKKQNAVKKQNIDEGKKLAIKIDTLRETAAETEASLAKFYSETIAQINKEIVEVAGKRDVLLGEVKELEEAKARALEPLTAEQEAIDIQKAEIEQLEAKLAEKLAELDHRESEIRSKEQFISNELIRLQTKTDSTIAHLDKAIEYTRETEEAKEQMLKSMSMADDIRTKLETEVVHRERVCAELENSVIIREVKLKDSEAELLKGWRLLEDRKALIERNIKRTNQ